MKKACIVSVVMLVGTLSLFAQQCGDVNASGAVDIVDALMTAQYSVGLNPANFSTEAADANGDGSINIVDALMLAQYYVGIITTLSCSTVQPTTPPGGVSVYQAEDATISEGAVETEHSGYTGSGYVNLENNGTSYLEFSVYPATSGMVSAGFRFANGSGSDRPMEISVNGSVVAGSFSFPDTGAWTSWQTASLNLNLNSGLNTIRARSANSSGGPNLDSLTLGVSSNTPVPTTPPTQPPVTPAPSYDPGVVDPGLSGFAAVDGGTTGGSGGQTVTVSSASALIDYIARPEPYVIQVSGTINLPVNTNTDEAEDMYNVASHKTIIGLGSNARITGCGFKIGINVDDDITSPPSDAIHNVIIRNLTFSDYGDDAVNVQMFSHHVWVDHCTFYEGFDGSVDIKRGSNYCTVSWNHFDNTDKTCLLGHDDGNAAQDSGRLKVTYHHNWFDGSIQRNPRVRFGQAHVFNNYAYENSGHFIGAGDGCSIYAEANYVYNTVKSDFKVVKDYGGTDVTFTSSNVLDSDSYEIQVNNGNAFNPSGYYSYSVDPAADIPNIVMNGAGVGKI